MPKQTSRCLCSDWLPISLLNERCLVAAGRPCQFGNWMLGRGRFRVFEFKFWRNRLTSMLLAMLTMAAPQATAMMSSDKDARTLPADNDYAKGRAAFELEDWENVIHHMTDAVKSKPWHDDAYSLMGFAHRKLGDFERSLRAYDKALKLNPHNRGALEYLGEAYLDLDQPGQTWKILSRLALACERVAARFADGDWRTDCEEWVHLNAAYQAHITGKPRPEGGAPKR